MMEYLLALFGMLVFTADLLMFTRPFSVMHIGVYYLSLDPFPSFILSMGFTTLLITAMENVFTSRRSAPPKSRGPYLRQKGRDETFVQRSYSV